MWKWNVKATWRSDSKKALQKFTRAFPHFFHILFGLRLQGGTNDRRSGFSEAGGSPSSRPWYGHRTVPVFTNSAPAFGALPFNQFLAGRPSERTRPERTSSMPPETTRPGCFEHWVPATRLRSVVRPEGTRLLSSCRQSRCDLGVSAPVRRLHWPDRPALPVVRTLSIWRCTGG